MSLGVKIPFYTTQEKVAKLKEFVQVVTKKVCELTDKDVEDNNLAKSENISKYMDRVINRVESDRTELSKAIQAFLAQGVEIDTLNAAHKSDIDKLKVQIEQLNIAHDAKIESMKWSFAEAALQTWPYPKENSDRPPAPIRPAPTPSEETEAPTCVICLEKPPIMACVPCGHKCLCEDCATEEIKTCPICRAPITDYLRIFEKKMPAPANPFFI